LGPHDHAAQLAGVAEQSSLRLEAGKRSYCSSQIYVRRAPGSRVSNRGGRKGSDGPTVRPIAGIAYVAITFIGVLWKVGADSSLTPSEPTSWCPDILSSR
jgi:hypothetical protein